MNDKEFNFHFPFGESRKFQKEITKKIIDIFSRKKYVICDLPTGIGKSVIAYTIASYLADRDKSTYILTSQKSLQEQYVQSFKNTKTHQVYSVFGKNNYTCDLNESLSCDYGVCKTKTSIKCNCPYVRARDVAYNNKISVFNYSYFLNMSQVNPESAYDSSNNLQLPRHLMVMDEAHNAEKELLSFMECKLSRIDFKKYELGKFMEFPKENESDQNKYKWLKSTARPKVFSKLQNEIVYLESISEEDSDFKNQADKVNYLQSLICDIDKIVLAIDDNIPGIITQEKGFTISFKLLYGKTLTKTFFKYAEKFLFMSATIFSKEQFCKDMGIDPSEVGYIKIPSTFPKENRPIYPLNIGKINFKTMKEMKPVIKDIIKKVLKKHKNERGIIHCTNYDLTDYLIREINDPRLFCPKGKNRDKNLKKFLNNKDLKDGVLISPSLHEGIDLIDDLSRFTVIIKVPYPNLGDEFIKSRMEIDSKWYNLETVRTLIQSSGRSIRSETDKASTYILDSGFNDFLRRNIKLIPKWWTEAIVRIKR
jgi:Rad3-related DNA helicase